LAITAGNLANDILKMADNPSDSLIMKVGFGVLLLISLLGFSFLFKKKKE
jgi:hypothetical protein